MKIIEYGSVKSTSATRKKRDSASVGGFADILGLFETTDTDNVVQMRDVASATAPSNIIGLQEISEEEVQRKKALTHGKILLDGLEELRHQLLMGRVSIDVLGRLGEQLARQRQMVSDPSLLALMDDIELRAAVELAKFEKAMAPKNPL